jgi:hypothetical protein
MKMKTPFSWLFRFRGTKSGVRILGAYLAVYTGLSLLGRYQDNIESLDKLGIITKGMPDRNEWQPILIIITHFPHRDSILRSNVPGYLFMPLVFLDRHLCHPTEPITYDTQ